MAGRSRGVTKSRREGKVTVFAKSLDWLPIDFIRYGNQVFGNQASVLVGDFLYSRAFQMMAGLNRMRVMDILSDATNTIAQGEVMQLMNCNDPNTTEASYLEVIYSKTARLFEAATQLAAVLTEQTEQVEIAMQSYGRHLGTAFQLIDDILDYDADTAIMGKNTGDDLAHVEAVDAENAEKGEQNPADIVIDATGFIACVGRVVHAGDQEQVDDPADEEQPESKKPERAGELAAIVKTVSAHESENPE